MKPATSLIIFTVFSGFGLGLLFWLNLNLHSIENFPNIISFPIAFLITSVGLISSTFHLGNPQRALLAFTQWRSSWLSREAVLASLTLVISFINALFITLYDLYFFLLGIIAAGLCLITIFSTAMIYAQMKTVPRWNMKMTPALFLLYGTAGSAFILNAPIVSSFLFLFLGVTQSLTWKFGDKQFKKFSDINTATGLSKNNKFIRMLEPPHTGSNYLMKEMVHIVAQKHIFKLRWISLCLVSILPAILSLAANTTEDSYSIFLLIISLISVVGTLISRWLFFSEAEHVVGLYYDR